jgi:N-acetylneuraminic acid mutarotase
VHGAVRRHIRALGCSRIDVYCTLLDRGLCGGWGAIRDGNHQPLSIVEKYSPLSDTWSTMAPLLAAHIGHAAVAVGPVMYVLGGFDGESCLARVLKFDSTQNTWNEVAPMSHARFAHAACVLGSEIYVFGGYDNNNRRFATDPEQVKDSVFKYEKTSGRHWRLCPWPAYISAWRHLTARST